MVMGTGVASLGPPTNSRNMGDHSYHLPLWRLSFHSRTGEVLMDVVTAASPAAADAAKVSLIAADTVWRVILDNAGKYPDRKWTRIGEDNHITHILDHLTFGDPYLEPDDDDLAHALCRIAMLIYLRAHPEERGG